MRPLTVILSAYNRPERLLRSVASVERQTIRDQIELIIADNGSPGEQQREILRGLERTGTKVLWGPVEMPEERAKYCVVSAMINRALDIAEGQFIRYLLDSDEYTPSSCEDLLLYGIQRWRPGNVGICLWGKVQYRKGGAIVPASSGYRYANHEEIAQQLQISNFINHNSAIHTRTDLARWDTSHMAWKKSDWLFWLRLLKAGFRFASVDSVVETYDTDGRMGNAREASGKSIAESLKERYT